MATGHGGNLRQLARLTGRSDGRVLDFSANINPLGPPACLRPTVSRALDEIVNYPDPDASGLVEAICARYQVRAQQVVVGNGSSEILYALTRAMTVSKAGSASVGRTPPKQATLGGGTECLDAKTPMLRAVVPVPAYIDYARAAELAGLAVTTLAMREANGFAVDWAALAGELAGGEVVFLGQPNNPTGALFDTGEFRRFAAGHPATLFVVDEAFADFVEQYDSLIRDVPANTIVLRSLTKFYAVPGLRLGFAVAPAALADRIHRQIDPWSVNSLAQAVGEQMLADEDYASRTRQFVAERRCELAAQLAAMPGLHVYPGRANFLLVRLDRGDVDAFALAARMLSRGVAIRTFPAGQHLDGRFFRLAVRTREENDEMLDVLSAALDDHGADTQKGAGGTPAPQEEAHGIQVARSRRKRAAAIMFQGTSSNAGKSVLTAAMCRILLQDGWRVAPFKSQNMSLNSFVTRDGREMGRAQAVQAQACRLECDVRMNPILLKPNSDTGCQVIVRGRPVGNMKVLEYVRYKPQAFAAAKECYDSLASEFDVVVLEGAGSPGEVNLKSHDIVNMQMARHADAPVLIVGDIDRGGVFASFVGTMEVLDFHERRQVAGWIVNRFRGDASLLGDALDYTLAHTGRPVLGVVPYLPALNIPQEDSVEFKSGALDDRRDAAVELAVIDLPHISNFTDFDAFGVEGDVRVRIVRSADELDGPDAVIIPGSKNTLGDLEYLNRSGLASKIRALAATGKAQVVGVCGGFQILGRQIRDPHGMEGSAGGCQQGLGLLEVDTVLAADKTLVRAEARHVPSGMSVSGYEIHHGQTPAGSLSPLFVRADGEAMGVGSADHRVWGTYLHGVFDADAFRRWFIDRLRAAKGLAPLGAVSAKYDIEPALDRLAAVVRQSLKMDEIYRLLDMAMPSGRAGK